jgi:hypothetical protein
MIPFQVDPSWYERYWLTERPARRRWTRLSALIKAAGRRVAGAAGLAHFGHGEPATDMQTSPRNEIDRRCRCALSHDG